MPFLKLSSCFYLVPVEIIVLNKVSQYLKDKTTLFYLEISSSDILTTFLFQSFYLPKTIAQQIGTEWKAGAGWGWNSMSQPLCLPNS